MNKINACEKCHRLFESNTTENICPECKRNLETKFIVVKKYIRSNRSAGLNEVSSKCGITTNQLLKWVREERLFFDESSDVAIPCMNCGDLIKIGKYCPKCKTEMKRNLTIAYSTLKEKEVAEVKVVAVRSKIRHRHI